MPCPRTPPPFSPNGYEKQTEAIEVACTETEKLLWQLVFGPRKIADTVRILMNQEANRRAGVKPPKRIPG